MSRDAALAALDSAKASFVAAISAVPGEALAFRKPEDDYSLGGLIAHNVGVVQHYRIVLGALVASSGSEVRPEDPAGFWDTVAERSKAPLAAAGCAAALAELDAEHTAFMAELGALHGEAWDAKRPVFYGTAEEPLDTGAEDIAGWVGAHYEEHVPHVHELEEAWRAGSA
ncbi:MAG TPA: hypothetical protein VFW71_00020 [Actinomycetota bacterium]|nr:hypothetical protein [Actinomycetota bacterium]